MEPLTEPNRHACAACLGRAGRGVALTALLLLTGANFAQTASAQASAAQASEAPMPGDYRVVEGRVDAGTYTGWRLFHTTCYGCHGVGGVGTDLAPNLLERIKTLTPRGFATKVLTSYRIVLPDVDADGSDASAMREAQIEEIMRRRRGPRGRVVMPAWGADPSVSPHVLDLYAYLSARSDGALGPGEPLLWAAQKRIDKKDVDKKDVDKKDLDQPAQ